MKVLFNIFLIIALSLVLVGCGAQVVPPDSVGGFFEGVQWDELIGYGFSLLFGLVPGFNLFQFLKEKWGLEGEKAHWFVLGLSLLITTLAMAVTGVFDTTIDLTFGTLLEWWLFIYAGSQVAYQRFKQAQIAKLPIVDSF